MMLASSLFSSTSICPAAQRCKPLAGGAAPTTSQHHSQRQQRKPLIATAAAATSAHTGGGNGSTPPPRPPAGGGGGGGAEEPGADASARHSLGRSLAAAAAAYMLLGLYQPWRWLSATAPMDTSVCTVSIIIPVLNEAGSILDTLRQLRQLQPAAAELIVVDGGSTDGTAKLVRKSGLADKVVSSGRGRAVQMNAGAEAATGDFLCFLHADTQPPNDLVHVMRTELRDPDTVLAGFVPSIEVPGRRLWLLSFHNFISTYYAPLLFRPLSYVRGLRGLFGDQTMFCRACDFRAVGGFDTRWRIMEDTDLCVRMHDAGPCRHHNTQTAATSSSSSAAVGRTQQQQSRGPSINQQQENKQQQQKQQPGGLMLWWQRWRQPRGRVKQVLNRLSVTSGRRLDAWGPVRATYIHFVIGSSWYFCRDPVQLEKLYEQLYTDAFR